jgi:hypothetical protein
MAKAGFTKTFALGDHGLIANLIPPGLTVDDLYRYI